VQDLDRDRGCGHGWRRCVVVVAESQLPRELPASTPVALLGEVRRRQQVRLELGSVDLKAVSARDFAPSTCNTHLGHGADAERLVRELLKDLVERPVEDALDDLLGVLERVRLAV
jgi:hypothetical protein